MKARFKNHMDVRVTDENHPCYGMMGKVVRLRLCDAGAWVCMEKDLPVQCQSFPGGDDRFRHLVLYPDECQPTGRPLDETINRMESAPKSQTVLDALNAAVDAFGEDDEDEVKS